MEALEELRLDYTEVAFANVRALPSFSRLQELGLGGLGIEDLSSLSAMTQLRRLYLYDNAVADIAPLAGLVNLRALDLSGNDIEDVSALSAMTQLRWLYLHNNAVDDIAALADLVNVGTLDLSGNRISDVSALSAMTKLRWLYLHNNAVDDIAALADLVNVWTLNLSGNRISDVSALSAMTKLRTLDLRDNAVADIAALAELVELKGLNLAGNAVADIAALAELAEVEALDLAGNGVDDLSALAAMTKLRRLDVGGNALADVAPLADLTSLKALLLSGNRIKDVSPLGRLNGIQFLYLTGNAVSDIGPLVDRSVFAAGAFVSLEGNPLDEVSVNEHIPTLRSWGINVSFARRGSSVTPTSIVDPTLRSLIAETLSYQSLHVDDNVTRWPIERLRELRARGAGITDLAGLDAARGLQRLYAASNLISDLSPLAELAELTSLDLRHNRISDLGPLVANGDLAEGDWVSLDGNPLSEEAVNTHVPALLERGVSIDIGTVLLAVSAGGEARRFEVSGYFEALLGEGIATSAASEDESMATAEAVDGDLVVTPGGTAGTVGVEVTARDAAGDTETLTFLVTVRGPWIVPLFPSADDASGRQGFVRVANRDRHPGEVRVVPVDDTGTRRPPLTLVIEAGEAAHFNSQDLENGNPDKGLTGSSGGGTGDWRLELESAHAVEVLSYVRTVDGLLTAMHDIAPVSDNVHRVATFNPASNLDQVSSLRIFNSGGGDAAATITGIDDHGASSGPVRIDVPAGAAVTLTAEELEEGTAGLRGVLGDGRGKWRLRVESDGDLGVVNLLASPGGHLTNLSTGPVPVRQDGVHVVPLFPSAANSSGRQGFVRVINRAHAEGLVRIEPQDDGGQRYEALELSLGPRRVAHFNSDDLELGAAEKGLVGNTGSGIGDWRLELSSDLDIEVLAYVRTPGGFLTAIHDVVPSAGRRYDVATFNPAGNTDQRSKLRIVNVASRPAHVSIAGIDDAGEPSGGIVQLSIPAGVARTLAATQLERGNFGLRGALGDGAGKWRLAVDSEQPIVVMNLLESPTGHLANLSTRPSTQ